MILKEAGSLHRANVQGNLPIHWAAQNGKLDAVKFLVENYDNIDMLVQNTFGRSVLTEAFQSQNADVIEACLSHPSASEEKLMPQSARQASANATAGHASSKGMDEEMEDNDESMDVDESDEANGKVSPNETNAVYHWMSFLPKRKAKPTLADSLSQSLHISGDVKDSSLTKDSPNTAGAPYVTARVPCVRVRELPITRADNPFGSDSSPELDTTGLGIWPASILAARWVIHNRLVDCYYVLTACRLLIANECLNCFYQKIVSW